MRHLTSAPRRLFDVARRLPYKTRCGLQRADLGTAEPFSKNCPDCYKEGRGDETSWGFTVEQALDIAKLSADRGGRLRQHHYQRLMDRLTDPMDKNTFAIALAKNQLRVARTALQNIVDREEPGPGDAGSAAEGDIFSIPQFPLAEGNNSPDGTTVLDYNKPMRSEGSPSGWNLSDLTTATVHTAGAGYGVGDTELYALLNEGIGLEFSQGLRYRTYAEQMLTPIRDALAEEFLDHADVENDHAQRLLRHLVALGGKPDFTVDRVEMIDPSHPDAIEDILDELYRAEQLGLDYYMRLRAASADTPFAHVVEEIIAVEVEHTDDMARLAHVLVRTAAIVPTPAPPFAAEPARWNESYHDENQFEGLQKMGAVCECEAPDMGTFPHQCDRCGGDVRPCIPMPKVIQGGKRIIWRRKADLVKRNVRCGEIPVSIEWNKGETRKGVGKNGPWERVMQSHYGFIPNTSGADNEPIDVYVGDTPQSRRVFVVSQLSPDTNGFDEEKVMLGYSSPEIAEASYRSHYPDNGSKHFGGLKEMTVDAFINDYVRNPGPDAYVPKLEVKQVPKEVAADHGPGDADGCGGTEAPSSPAPTEEAPTPAPVPSAPKAPAKKPTAPAPSGLGSVDTSPVKSPAEEAWKGTPGKGKQTYDQLMKLLGGPGFNPYEASLDETLDRLDVGLTASLDIDADLYESLHGPLADPDPPAGEVRTEHV